MQKCVQIAGIDHHNRVFFGYHTFINEIARDLKRRLRGTLTITRLEHEELFVFYGELHVLHVFIVLFKGIADFIELLEHFGHNFIHLANLHGGADTGDDVLALRVHQEFAKQNFFTCCGVTSKRYARAGGFAHVAEHHHLHVDSGAP